MIKRSSKAGDGGAAPIGSQQILGYGSAGNNAHTTTLGDGSVWLKSGVVGLASDFPDLAALPRYGFVGKFDYSAAGTTPEAPAPNAVQCLDSSRDILLIASNTAGKILRSTDGGATFTSVTLTGCLKITGIASNGTDLILVLGVYQSGGSMIWRSTDGAAWAVGPSNVLSDLSPTDGGTLSVSPLPGDCSSGALAWAGTKFVGAYVASAGNGYIGYRPFTTVNGVAITKGSANMNYVHPASTYSLGLASDGAGNVALFANETTVFTNTMILSTDSGTTWTTASAGATLIRSKNGFGLAVSGGKAYFAGLSDTNEPNFYVVPTMSSMSSGFAPATVNGVTVPGTSFVKFGGGLYLVGSNCRAKINESTYALEATNIVSSTLFVGKTKIFSYGQRSKVEMVPITDNMDRADSCGFLGTSVPNNPVQTSALNTNGATYVRAK